MTELWTLETCLSFVTGPVINTLNGEKGDSRYRQVMAVIHSFLVSKGLQTGGRWPR